MGVGFLVACGAPFQLPDAFRVDSVSPLSGTVGTVLTLEGSLPEGALIEVCGVPLAGVAFEGQERVTVGPGLGGVGSGFTTARGTVGEVPYGAVCEVSVRVDGRDLTVDAPFVTDPVASNAVSAGGGSFDGANSVRVLPDGSAIVAGYYVDAASFGSATLTSAGSEDGFVAKVDEDGTWLWASSAGGVGFDAANSVGVSSDGSPLVAGSFTGTASFGSTTLTSAGSADAFVAKLTPDGAW